MENIGESLSNQTFMTKAGKQVSKSKKRSQQRVEGVALTGSVAEWDKLPARIRTLVKNSVLMRLSQIRNQIAEDAGLPMPKIYVVPYCLLLPDNSGPVYAKVCPMPCEKVDGGFEYSVTTTAATLIMNPKWIFLQIMKVRQELFNRRFVADWHSRSLAFEQIYPHPAIALEPPPVCQSDRYDADSRPGPWPQRAKPGKQVNN